MDALFCAELLSSHLFTRTSLSASGGEASILATCEPFAFISQFASLGAELYFACLSIDLVLSTSNPFTDYRWNVVRYHLTVLLLSAGAGMVLLLGGENGRPMYGYDNFLSICWVRNYNESGGIDSAFYIFFAGPTAVIYVASALTLVYASRRLQQGLPETFEARLDMYRMSFRFVTMYLLYWCLSFGVFVITTLVDSTAPPDVLSLMVAIALGGRGVVALLVWLLTYGRNLRCSRRGLIILGESTSSGGSGSVSAAAKMDAVADLRPFLNTALRKEILYYATIGIARSVLRAKKSKDHKPDGYAPSRATARFSPAAGSTANTRRDIAYNVLMLSRRKEEVGLFDLEAKQMRARRDSLASAGARHGSPEHGDASVARGGLLTPLLGSFMAGDEHEPVPPLDLRGSLTHTPPHSPSAIDTSREPPATKASTGVYGSWPTLIANAICGPADTTPRFRFVDYEPWLFRTLRALNGIDEADYIRALSRTKREKFGEGGASGAFLYFSADERFIVKTLTRAECDTLCAMLHDYAVYMTSHPHALITRFYGAHELHMYGTVLYLVVMANVLTTGGTPSLTLHERYDLKGSWIARHRTPIERGQRVECRYCGQTFRAGGGDRFGGGACPERPNRPHEANTVLKDNDLTVKLRLTRDCAQALGDQISADTEFLRRHGITDYSLLLGVHRTKYKLVSGTAGAHGAGVDGMDTPVGTTGVPTPYTGSTLASTALTSPAPLTMMTAALPASAGATRGTIAVTGIAGALESSPPTAAAILSASAPLTHMPTRRTVVSTPTAQDGFIPSRSAPHTRPPRAGTQSAAVPAPIQLPQSLGDSRWGFDTGGELAQSPAVPAPIVSDVEAGFVLAPASPAASSRIVTGIPISSPDITPMRSLAPSGHEDETGGTVTAAVPIPRRGAGRGRTRGTASHAPGSSTGVSASSDTLLTTLQRHRVAQAAAAAAASSGDGDSAPPSLLLTMLAPPAPIRESRASITIADEEDASGGVYEEDDPGMQPVAPPPPPPPPASQRSAAAAPILRAASDAADAVQLGGSNEAVRLLRAASAQDVWSSSPGRGDQASLPDSFGAPVLRLHDPARANAVRRVLEASTASQEDDEEMHARGAQPLTSVDPFFRAYRGGLRSTIVEGPGIYYMGIIDVLQTYTIVKRLERWLKIYFACANGRGLSVMPPDEYAARFRTRVIGQLIDGYQHRDYVWDDEFGDM